MTKRDLFRKTPSQWERIIMTEGQKRGVTMVARQFQNTGDLDQLIEDLDTIFCLEEE